MIEVPTPDLYVQPKMAAAVGDLTQAFHHMNEGRDRDAVGSLRDALESVPLAFGDSDENIPGDLRSSLSRAAGP